MGCYVFSSQCDDSDLLVSRTVVVDRPIVAKGNIKSGQILYPIGIAATNHIRRNIVASSRTRVATRSIACSGSATKNRAASRSNLCLCPFYELYIRTRGQCRFKSKIRPFGQQVVHPLKHQSSCFDRHAFRVERRQAFRYFIRIDELLAAEHFG